MRRQKDSSKVPKTKPKRPEWDSTLSDLSMYKQTLEEREQRRIACMPKQRPMGQRDVYQRLYQNGSKSRLDRKKLDEERMIREMFSDEGQLWDVLTRTDEAMSVVTDLFGDTAKKYRGLPRVTPAPQGTGCSTPRSGYLPQTSTLPPEIHELKTALDHMSSRVNRGALNDDDYVSDASSQSETAEYDSLSEIEEVEKEGKLLDGLERFKRFVEDERRKDAAVSVPMEKKDGTQTKSDSSKSFPGHMRHEGQAIGPTEQVLRVLVDAVEARTQHTDRNSQENNSALDTSPLDPLLERLIRGMNVCQRTSDPHRTSPEKEVKHLRELVDALTMDLISTKEKCDKIGTEFKAYKERTELEISKLKSALYTQAAVADAHKVMQAHSAPDRVTPPGVLNPPADSPWSSPDSSEEEDPPLATELASRQKIVEQLAQLQEEHEAAQRRLRNLMGTGQESMQPQLPT